MIIGVPKEIKKQEYRVGLVPSAVKQFVDQGHEVFVEKNAGQAIGYSDDSYKKSGAKIVESAQEVFDRAEMIVKVKEPQLNECKMLKEGQIIFTYLHLAPDPEQAKALIESKCVAIAYETITDERGGLPLLEPMSIVAGRLSVQEGAHYLQKHCGGLGRLMGGVAGADPVKVLVIGGGTAGFNAAEVAVGMGANVTILERSEKRMAFLKGRYGDRANILFSDDDSLTSNLKQADMVIGAVLVPGASAPKLVRKDHLKTMKNGAVMVDIAIDQGGCFETSKPTTHDDPIYEIDGVIHYCVANMPGAVPLTSTLALNHVTVPYALQLANKGWEVCMQENSGFKEGLNVCHGKITNKGVALSLKMD
ncbi:MAG: alanine dehydrogenase [Bdellovibrionales bacterium]